MGEVTPMSILTTMRLTQRETEVLRFVAMGFSAKETAQELHIAPCTVERHVENVRLKTRTRNRAHMVAHALQTGLIHPVAIGVTGDPSPLVA
jgi:DNA-binding CsgD family transcriptional regulator